MNEHSLGLEQVGIAHAAHIFRNLSYEELFEHETASGLEGNERCVVTASGAVAVDTGKYTGRSPKDKYIVREPENEKNVWWAAGGTASSSDNKAIDEETWKHLHSLCCGHLTGKRLYVMDGFAGTNPKTRLSVRLITDVAWMAHFFKNMFLRPTALELASFRPDWTVINACKIQCEDFKARGLRSDVFVAFHLARRMTVIGGTWYGGEIKKGIFSIMNYFLPLQGVGSFHCSANAGKNGDTALFFGLSGTGKTTLSTDPKRALIGDDEHGWDDEGVFNFEGGCYAKCINLSAENEPEIYEAIRRDALLENVVIRADGSVDYDSGMKTENTRASYPIDHIGNIVRPVSKGGHPSRIIFLTCDAYGVFPPVTCLTQEQAMYHFLSGYTAKVAGTELGVTEPKATFSACFGQAFLMLHPTRYADILGEKMARHGARAYLVNTGWIGGKYGVGKRISIKQTRAIIDAILDGSIDRAACRKMPVFNVDMPTALPGVDTAILNPREAWQDKAAYDRTTADLGRMFQEHFKQFCDTPRGLEIAKAGLQA